MFDDGSAITILEEEIADALGLKGRSQALTLQWYNQRATTETSKSVRLEISDVNEELAYDIKNVRTIRGLSLPVQSFCKADYKHFECVPISDYANVKPAMLIGLDNTHLGVVSAVIQNNEFNPLAAKTKLGWVAYGTNTASTSASQIVLHIQEEQTLNDLNKAVTEYFMQDGLGIDESSPMLESLDNIKARDILQHTTKRIGDRFETGLIWKKYPPELPNNYEMARIRLIGIEKRMVRNTSFGDKYISEMAKYIEKGYARQLTENEIENKMGPIWYLPHFAVRNPHRPDKMRIVFDAAASVIKTSLNSELLKGPEQAKSFLTILFKFREGPIAVAADIREMFSQVKIRANDQNAQRFPWKHGDTDQAIPHYVMTSMVFGAVCSPCCAEYVKNINAEDYRKEYPDAVAAIIERHYVDDFVCSFPNEEEAKRVCKEVIFIHAKGGFELRNFVSNSKQVQETMKNNSQDRIYAIDMEKQASTEKVLGMFWNTTSDSFMFSTKFHRIPTQVLKGERAPTKRELLGIVMAVFDPYGLLADFLLFSKILVQESWKCQIVWDDPIPVNMQKKWNAWWTEFQKINTFKISRCYSPSILTSSDIQLHVFVDASQKAFAAVGYFRIVYGNQVDVTFIAGKTRCAPQKLMSVPRLELQAAVLGARLSTIICQKHDVDVSKIIYWSDSRIVLHWIYSTERKFKPFVSHRISIILNISKPPQWRWVPTHHNSADCATRASVSPKYCFGSKWITGPDFLKLPDEELFFAAIASAPDVLEEEVKSCLILQPKASNSILQINKFSSYLKLTRTMAWVQRAVKIFLCQERDKRFTIRGSLTVTKINKAEEFICRFVQASEFAEEIIALKNNKLLKKASQLFSLSPYLDENGLLRISGRIDEAQCLPYSARRPIIMPKNHVVSELIIRHYHEKYHHQNSALPINAFRQKFWVPHCKSMIRSYKGKCLQCKLEKAKPLPPMMGQLPEDRITPYVRPFTYTGVDLFGAFNVAVGRRREKRWAVIFTCLTVRAAHLELAENLSTYAFLVCLRNFVSRRGNPVRIRSDNGTNFIGAQKELKESERLLHFHRISDEATAYNIEWAFNCPANPSSGGCWERLIGIVKRLLQKTVHEEAPRVETLRTVLIEAENIINSCPLTDIPLTSQEDEPLTPNHFLLGYVNSTQTPHLVDTKICLRKQWRIAQNLKDRLWKRWTLKYLPQLLCRSKWHKNATPLKINDLVLICEQCQPRSLWKKGRITQVYPVKDGQVRFAEIKTSSGLVRRPATRLAVLEVDGESTKDSRGVECGVTL